VALLNGGVEIRVLGPLEVVEDGRILRPGSRKQVALLALLVLRGNRGASRDLLIEELWHGKPPAAAETTLRSYVSRLRSIVGADRLQTRRPGYALVLDPEELDAHRFEQLLGAGRETLASGQATGAVTQFREALALWRGDALHDVRDEPFAQAEIARLNELRLQALEERIEADLALGRHEAVVPELEKLVGEHSLRERLCRQLMVALYRSGRQAEALATYANARHTLSDELGLEPGHELRALERAILRQDASLELLPVADEDSERTELARGTFVGRQREFEELLNGFADVQNGHGRLFLLVGEPGIGKSRLAEELTHHAQARGADILVGRCWEAGGAPAYWPWVQALRTCIRLRDPSELRTELGRGAPELAHLLPELRELFPTLPEPVAPDSEGARFRLFQAVAAFLREASRLRPIVLIVDDLHAADAPSLLLLQFVARELADARLLLLGAYRDVDPTVGARLGAALSELVREPVTTRITLSGLAEDDIAAYIEVAAGSTPQTDIVGAIHAETEGNPLFMGEVVRLLVAEGALDMASHTLRVPDTVRGVIDQRLRRLSDDGRELLVLASVLGREFGIQELARLADVSPAETLAILDETMVERIVGEVPGASDRLRFAHVLIRDTIYDGLTVARRVELHHRTGEALETFYADGEPHLAELAHHFYAAAPAGETTRAIKYTQLAAERAVHLLAYEEAARLYEMALSLSDDDVKRCDLFLALGEALGRAGDTPASKHAFRRAFELADAEGLPEQLARAAFGYGGRILWEVSRDDRHSVPLLEHALAALGEGDSPLRVRLLARLAGGPLRDASFPAEQKAALSEEAIAMARRIGDPTTLMYALYGYLLSQIGPDTRPGVLEVANECRSIAMEVGDKERLVECNEQLFQYLLERGDIEAARPHLETVVKLANELRQRPQLWISAVNQAILALLQGRFDEADRLIHEALEIGGGTLWNARVSYRLQLYALRRAQGRLHELQETFAAEPQAFHYRTYPILDCMLARFYDELDRKSEARAIFEGLAADGFAALPFDEEWLVSLSLLAEVAHSLGDKPRAAYLYESLSPYSDWVGLAYPEISMGSVSRYLGILASTLGRWDDGERHFEKGMVMNERIGARPWLAYTQEDYARMLLSRQDPGDLERAEQLLADATTMYRELGMRVALVNASG
jgi:DNA-binding SARP family transcriptional activator